MKTTSKNSPSLLPFIKRYHLVMFTVLMTVILSVSILLLYGVVNKASGENAAPQNGLSTSFDQATIDRINQLKTPDEPSQPLNLSQGRINPFSE